MDIPTWFVTPIVLAIIAIPFLWPTSRDKTEYELFEEEAAERRADFERTVQEADQLPKLELSPHSDD